MKPKANNITLPSIGYDVSLPLPWWDFAFEGHSNMRRAVDDPEPIFHDDEPAVAAANEYDAVMASAQREH